MLKITILGASGRMGQSILRCTKESTDIEIVGAVTEPDDAAIGSDVGEVCGVGPLNVFLTDDCESALQNADVAIDFTLPSATKENIRACVATNTALVIGTTGLGNEESKFLESGAKKIPLLYGRNMSVGMNVFMDLVSRTSKSLGIDYDVEITEAHHQRKIDSPSGTAIALGELIAETRGDELTDVAVYERHGDVGARTPGSIGFSVIRAGNIVGDHTVLFGGPEECIELTHRAVDRMAFAHGALRAARWLTGRKAGFYTMANVLDL
tara:strand:- start:1602 stop:2402 length:801 start_codon:yes stop_codon:yes gene_type:complete